MTLPRFHIGRFAISFFSSYYLTLFFTFFSGSTFAEPYYWTADGRYMGAGKYDDTHYDSLQAACDSWNNENIICIPGPIIPYYDQYVMSISTLYRKSAGRKFTTASFYRWGSGCPEDSVYNTTAGSCGHDSQKGIPPQLACQGNPINIAIGNKYQEELDYISSTMDRLQFSRFYNSLDGLWQHTFSAHIRFAMGQATVIRSDGAEVNFVIFDTALIRSSDSEELLKKVGSNWEFYSPNLEVSTFDADGKLVLLKTSSGHNFIVSRSGTDLETLLTITDDHGAIATVKEDAKHQPLKFSSGTITIDYSYDALGRLVESTSDSNGHTISKKYRYESPNGQRLLTGIIDQQGIAFASWSYDSSGRAITSSHAGGAENIVISYENEKVRVTNSLGKASVFKFSIINNKKQVTAIQGEPSANCPSSNSLYTYDSRGLMLSKTDAKGFITTYTYNDRGLETSRTETSGTPQARVTTTEWDPTRFLRTKVVEPTRTTVYTYDDQGRETGRQVSAR